MIARKKRIEKIVAEVRKAQTLINEARQDPDLSLKQRNNLQALNNLLLDIDDLLVLEHINGA